MLCLQIQFTSILILLAQLKEFEKSQNGVIDRITDLAARSRLIIGAIESLFITSPQMPAVSQILFGGNGLLGKASSGICCKWHQQRKTDVLNVIVVIQRDRRN